MTIPISEERKVYLKAYRERNKERLREQDREYRLKNIGKQRERSRRYYEDNKDKVRERISKYRSTPEVKEATASYHREYKRKKRDEIQVKQQAMYHNDIYYRLRVLLRNRLNLAIKDKHKSGSAVRDLGCSIDEFVVYISGLFKDGMSWDNRGEWHLDHVRPLASFDLSDRNQLLIACHYTNIQPLWATDNLRKKDKWDLGKLRAVRSEQAERQNACGEDIRPIVISLAASSKQEPIIESHGRF